jgi:hypothetical protein
MFIKCESSQRRTWVAAVLTWLPSTYGDRLGFMASFPPPPMSDDEVQKRLTRIEEIKREIKSLDKKAADLAFEHDVLLREMWEG